MAIHLCFHATTEYASGSLIPGKKFRIHAKKQIALYVFRKIEILFQKKCLTEQCLPFNTTSARCIAPNLHSRRNSLTMKTSKISVPRGTFNVRERGHKDGLPVVMLHGWPESSYCWEGVTAWLDPNLRVIAPDLRGLGDSERTIDVKAYQKVELARDMIE